MKPKYILERWPYGWLICNAPGAAGLPLDALNECCDVAPKGAVLDLGIVHHLSVSGRPDVQFCVVAEKDRSKWRDEITTNTLQGLDSESRWWKGFDVGTSASSMFSVFCSDKWKAAATEYGRGSTPRDPSDFGRCQRLLESFPEWKKSLHKVAGAFPDTAWPNIISRWDELEKTSPSELYEILKDLR